MTLVDLNKNESANDSAKTSKYLSQITLMLDELRNRDLPNSLIEAINKEVHALNTSRKTDYALHKFVKAKYHHLIKLIEKEVKVVPISYYRNLWLVLGISAFGLPFGMAFALSMGKMGFLGIGIPIGMAIGIGIGKKMDEKAKNEGRQFVFEMVY
jgi:hypothetical protein